MGSDVNAGVRANVEGSTGVNAGVGLTALLVAAARAIETHRPDPLARDPYAEHFVRAAPASAHWPVHPRDVPGGDADPLWGRLGRYFALRTRALDDQLLRAAHLGTRQVVLLGAGLDARALRLDWPPGRTVFEVDRPEVLAFKQRVLDGLGTPPAAPHRVAVEADFRTDWSPALTAAGFRPDLPTAWLAEGLLLYLPGAAERELVAAVDRFSAPGSTLAYEAKLGVESAAVRDNPVYTATRERIGVDLLALFDSEPRPDTPADLTARGWTTAVHTPFEFTRHYGRGPLPGPNDTLAANRWVFAARP
ncbi:class I SAM-dependent methyltransferase [Streptomyces sp. FH025]|uniref:class I SAM-dependent methyltransferase n=1 Tax=Streptomyces sp. FH025 TaxID=2815937 RepID=UPI0027DDCF4B|nr:class I SAM-dependent methyltransferase [Streptomyces sp. FH025]